MEQISPTRSELLWRRGQIRLARQGADLLRGKREALVREFLSELQRFVDTREALAKELAQARQSLMRALALDGTEAVASAGLASRRTIEVQTTERSIWGTRIVELATDYQPRDIRRARLQRRGGKRAHRRDGGAVRGGAGASPARGPAGPQACAPGGGDPPDLAARERPGAAPPAVTAGAGAVYRRRPRPARAGGRPAPEAPEESEATPCSFLS